MTCSRREPLTPTLSRKRERENRERRAMPAHCWTAAIVVLTLLAAPANASAQDFPSRTIRLIVGPSPDAITRIFADRMQKHWGTPVIVEPQPGAGGDIAAKAVSSADPDGYTLLNATSSFTLNTALQLANYDFVKDFEPVAMINLSSFVLIVN